MIQQTIFSFKIETTKERDLFEGKGGVCSKTEEEPCSVETFFNDIG